MTHLKQRQPLHLRDRDFRQAHKKKARGGVKPIFGRYIVNLNY